MPAVFPREIGAGETAILAASSVPAVLAALVRALDAASTGPCGAGVRVGDALRFEPASARTPAREAWLGGGPHRDAFPDAGHVDADDEGLVVLAAWPTETAPFPASHVALVQVAAARARELSRLQSLAASVERLEHAEQLQRALFAIADIAGSGQDMPSMLRGLHRIVSGLMYAENFYIALVEPDRTALRFLYFSDRVDAEGPPSDELIPLADIEHGLTWYLIHDGRPLMGSTDELSAQVSGPLRVRGRASHDFLGVPMLRDGRAVGAMVVQSYRPGMRYTEADRAVLAFVAGHVLTAVERKQDQENLEQRVAERTGQLAEANTVLQRQVLERERAEHLQATLYRISALASAEDSSDDFYRHIHAAVAELINAENFFIALLSDDGSRLDFPYSVDARDTIHPSRPLGRGLTEYVLRSGEVLLAGVDDVYALIARGEVATAPVLGTPAHFWLGVPLRDRDRVIGVVTVQSYRPDLRYDQSDAELLTFVSAQIATSLARRKHADTLRRLNSELEERVHARTSELRDQIAVREQVEARLQHQVMHDPLTGLPNRLYLRDRIERAISGRLRNRRRGYALMYLDIDRFKLFNDSLGHLAGDQVLCEVARRLLQCVRDPDVVARLSGDEFAVLLEDTPLPATAIRVAQRIQAALQRPMNIGGRDLQTSSSMGIAFGAERHVTVDDLLHDADIALYRAKAAGRQRFVLFDESLQKNAMDVLELEQQLRDALFNDQFEPWFQPIVRLDDGDIIGYEALVRWRHPSRGLLGPADFLAVAEESGLIEAIDWQMYRSAMRQGASLATADRYLTINVSPRHFLNDTFDSRLLALAAEAGFDPRHLRVEVTEGTLLSDPEAAASILERLRLAGVEAALDDFGTGYSSLGYLHRFPLKMIKIDRSCVRPLGADVGNRSSAIIRAILALAGSLDMDVVAEGVETAEQRMVLQQMGCRHAQGYLFGKPNPASHWQATAAAL